MRCVFQKGGLVGWLVVLDGLLFGMYVRKNFSEYPVGLPLRKKGKKKIIPGPQSEARAGWPKRLRLV